MNARLGHLQQLSCSVSHSMAISAGCLLVVCCPQTSSVPFCCVVVLCKSQQERKTDRKAFFFSFFFSLSGGTQKEKSKRQQRHIDNKKKSRRRVRGERRSEASLKSTKKKEWDRQSLCKSSRTMERVWMARDQAGRILSSSPPFPRHHRALSCSAVTLPLPLSTPKLIPLPRLHP